MKIEPFDIPGSDGRPILGDLHVPEGRTVGALLIAHGFKGYKDYGFIPRLAREAARCGLLGLRFNFSHSGMTNRIETFERPDLFERDTWGRQVHDMLAVAAALKSGTLPGGADVPVVWFGHSRGGVTCLLAARRAFDTDAAPPAAVIAAASPDRADNLDKPTATLLKKQGWLESPSSRTGQILRIGRDALLEVEADPDAYDPCRAAASLRCPLLLVHGDDDQTVPAQASRRMAEAAGAGARVQIIPGASHTFNAPNPWPDGEPAAEQTRQMLAGVCGFAVAACVTAETGG